MNVGYPPPPQYGQTQYAQISPLDQEIARYLRRGYQLVSRAEFTAHLLKPKRYNFLALLLFFVGGIGVILYTLYYLLIKRERAVYLQIDGFGRVISQEGPSGPRKRSEIVFALLLIVVTAAFIMMLVAVISQVSKMQHGVHTCTAANYSFTSITCNSENLTISVGDLSNARLTAGSKDGSIISTGPFSLDVIVKRQDPSGAFAAVGTVPFTVNGGASHTAVSLNSVFFGGFGPSATSGVYTLEADVTTPGIQSSLGSTTLTVTP